MTQSNFGFGAVSAFGARNSNFGVGGLSKQSWSTQSCGLTEYADFGEIPKGAFRSVRYAPWKYTYCHANPNGAYTLVKYAYFRTDPKDTLWKYTYFHANPKCTPL